MIPWSKRHIYSPAFIKGGYIGFGLSVIPSVPCSSSGQNFSFPLNIFSSFIEIIQILYAFILTRSGLGLSHILFHIFVQELNGPWFRPKFQFHSMSWEQIDRFSPNFIYAFILTRSMLGLLHILLLHIYTRVIALDSWQSFFSAQYLENKLTKFHQILYAFILTRSILGLLHAIFPTFVLQL